MLKNIFIVSSSLYLTKKVLATDALRAGEKNGYSCQDNPEYDCKGYKYLCNDPAYGAQIQDNCRKTCKVCELQKCYQKNCKFGCDQNELGEATCVCPEGYFVDKLDSTNCIDFNECAMSTNPCSGNKPHCINMDGSYTCSSRPSCGARKSLYYRQDECCDISTSEPSCGISSAVKFENEDAMTEKVIGGVKSDTARWPWQVYIIISQDTEQARKCGGTLISDELVITAAHCFDDVDTNYNSVTLYLGVDNQNVSQIEAFDTVVRVPRIRRDGSYSIHVHPDYSFPANDIAIVELNQKVYFDDKTLTVRPICLPNGEVPVPGQLCFATGWGWTQQEYAPDVTDVTVDFLREVMLPIRSSTECEKSNKESFKNNYNSTTMLCAGYPEGGKDTCKGDSGGPLVCQRCSSCNFYLAGVISYGEECALSGGIYGRYTKVAQYEDWINKIMYAEETELPEIQPQKCDKIFRNYWSSWSEWSECTATCGDSGMHKRSRTCLGDPSQLCTAENSQVEQPAVEYRECNRQSCMEDCCQFVHVSSIDTIFERLSADDYSYSLKIKEQGYRNIYKSGLQYLHYYLNSGHWWIGPTIGQPKGDHYIKSDQVCPENLGTQDWEVFNANQQNWRFYTLSVSCIEKFIVDSEWSKWSTCNCDTDNPERTRYRQCFASFNGQSNEVDSKYCMDQFENTASLSDQIYYERKACICGENCPNKILVEGGSKQTRRTGLYLKQNLASDSVVTYYSEETQNYIYRTNENYWWIGDTKGEMSGGFVAQVSSNNDLQKKLEYQALPAYENNLANDSECPPSDLTLWRSYQNKKWRPLQDDGMFIKHIYDNNGGLQDLAGLAMDNSWSNWSDCSESCQTADNIPTRSRENQVTLERQYENCDNLPVCPTLVCCDKVKVETSDLAVRAKQSDRFGTYKIMSIQFNNKPVYVKTLPKIEAEDDLQARSIGGASNTISIAESSVYIYYMPSHKVWLSGEELGQKTGGLLGLPFSPASQHCPEETKTWWAYISSTWEYDESLTVTCDTQPEYSDWSDFSECDEAGNQSRSRICLYNCNRDDFEYETYETVKCQEEILEESLPAGEITYTGEWAQWSDWSTCSNTCGLGARKRVRQCATPGGDSAVELGSIMDIGSYFYDYNDDFDAMAKKQEYMSYDKIGSDFEPTDLICEGESEEIDSCKRKECPEWSSWTPWNECSETCGENGNQMRERECVPGGVVLAVRLTIFRNNFDQDDEEVCPGEKVEYKQCNRHKCPEWSEWSLWSPCSVTCGRTPGSKTRSRTCQQYDDSQALLSVGDESFINMIPCEGLPKEQMACLPTLSTCPTSSKCSDLKNRHQNINQCKSWVRRGLCNNEETKAFMHTNCKKTCCQSDHGELCADVQSRCKSYASYCSDPKHQRFMHEKCPITCGTCNTGSRSTIIKNSILLKGVSNLGLGGSSDDSGRIKPNHEVTSLDNLGGLGLLAGVPPPNFYLGRD